MRKSIIAKREAGGEPINVEVTERRRAADHWKILFCKRGVFFENDLASYSLFQKPA
jgi:hypothetical protein